VAGGILCGDTVGNDEADICEMYWGVGFALWWWCVLGGCVPDAAVGVRLDNVSGCTNVEC